MSVTTIGATNSTDSNNSTQNVFNSSSVLGQDAFLKLLITQLRYQNPLEPMQDQEFISQLASFSSLEQMNNFNTKMDDLTSFLQTSLISVTTVQQAASFLGKEVTYKNGDEEVTGVVDEVRFDDSILKLVVGGNAVELANVVSIKSSEVAVEDEVTSAQTEVQSEAQ